MAVLCERSIQNILYIVIQITVISGKQCYIRETNQNLTKCEVSDWFAWNCFCCGTDVLQQNEANRVRGICCSEVAGQNIEKCKTECNIKVAVTESGLCAEHCSHITRASFCSFATTTSPSTISLLEISTLKPHQELISDGTTRRLAEGTRPNEDKEDGATTVNLGNITTSWYVTAQPWAVETGTNNEKDESPTTTVNLGNTNTSGYVTAQPWAGVTGTNNEKDESPTATVNLGNINTFCYIGSWTVREHINTSSTYI